MGDATQRKFVRTTTLFGKQYDWWTVDGVLTLLLHEPDAVVDRHVLLGSVVSDT